VTPDGRGLAIGVPRSVHPPVGRPFRHLRVPAEQVRTWLAGRPAVAVATATPLLADGLAAVDAAARAAGGPALLLALVSPSRRPYPTPTGLVRALIAGLPHLPPGSRVLVLPAPAHLGADELADAAAAYGATLADVPALAGDALDALDAALAGPAPAAVDPPEVAAALRVDRRPDHARGCVLLLTGLSGSGKSTIAQAVADALLEGSDRQVTLLDGDVVRRHLSQGLGFSRADRDTNVRRIGYVAAEVARHGGVAICAPIAPYAATRADVRRMVEQAGGRFLLVHVATPLEVCEARDRKGLYARARAGLVAEFTGISDPYEEPGDADLRVDTTDRPVAECVAEVLGLLRERGVVTPPVTPAR
jgi:sulfate adenylyltransferase